MLINVIKSVFAMQQEGQFAFKSNIGKFFVVVAIILGVYLIIRSADPVAYKKLIMEDGIVEYGSALLWLLAAITMFFTFLVTKLRTRLFVLSHVMLILFFIVCGGEEISWGQRIFGFQGPDALIEINIQNETNIHNIGSISIFSNTFFLLTIGFFIVFPMLMLGNEKIKQLVVGNDLPVVVYYSVLTYLVAFCVWMILGLRFGTLGFHPFSLWDYYNQMDDEIFEFYAAYSFFVFAVLNLLYKNRIGRFSKQ